MSNPISAISSVPSVISGAEFTSAKKREVFGERLGVLRGQGLALEELAKKIIQLYLSIHCPLPESCYERHYPPVINHKFFIGQVRLREEIGSLTDKESISKICGAMRGQPWLGDNIDLVTTSELAAILKAFVAVDEDQLFGPDESRLLDIADGRRPELLFKDSDIVKVIDLTLLGSANYKYRGQDPRGLPVIGQLHYKDYDFGNTGTLERLGSDGKMHSITISVSSFELGVRGSEKPVNMRIKTGDEDNDLGNEQNSEDACKEMLIADVFIKSYPFLPNPALMPYEKSSSKYLQYVMLNNLSLRELKEMVRTEGSVCVVANYDHKLHAVVVDRFFTSNVNGSVVPKPLMEIRDPYHGWKVCVHEEAFRETFQYNLLKKSGHTIGKAEDARFSIGKIALTFAGAKVMPALNIIERQRLILRLKKAHVLKAKIASMFGKQPTIAEMGQI